MARTKAMDVPSGDQRGAESRGPALRKRVGARAPVPTIAILVAYVDGVSVRRTVKSTCEPSGDICASPGTAMRSRSSGVMQRPRGPRAVRDDARVEREAVRAAREARADLDEDVVRRGIPRS